MRKLPEQQAAAQDVVSAALPLILHLLHAQICGLVSDLRSFRICPCTLLVVQKRL